MINELTGIASPGREPACFIACTPEERERVFRLRYECYRRDGSIEPRPDEQFRDGFDELPNNFSFLVREPGEEALATVRISVVKQELGWTDSPARHVYGDHPAFQGMARDSFVEANRLCFSQQARRDTFVRLLGHMSALAEYYDVEWLVACPRVEHSKVYQRMFGFQPLAALRRYFGVKFEAELLGIRRTDLQARVRDAKPMARAWSSATSYLIQSPLLTARAACA